MSSRYLPIAQVRFCPDSPIVVVKSTAHQSALRPFCIVSPDGFPNPHRGHACLHIENASSMDVPQVRVEYEGRTIGFLSREDAHRYRFKLQSAGLGDGTLGVPVCIRGGSLKDEGPPFFFFAELNIDLHLDTPWTYESISDKPLNDGSGNPDAQNFGSPGLPPRVLASLGERNRLNVTGEIFGRGFGFLICLILLYLFYCLYFALFFR